MYDILFADGYISPQFDSVNEALDFIEAYICDVWELYFYNEVEYIKIAEKLDVDDSF